MTESDQQFEFLEVPTIKHSVNADCSSRSPFISAHIASTVTEQTSNQRLIKYECILTPILSKIQETPEGSTKAIIDIYLQLPNNRTIPLRTESIPVKIQNSNVVYGDIPDVPNEKGFLYKFFIFLLTICMCVVIFVGFKYACALPVPKTSSRHQGTRLQPAQQLQYFKQPPQQQQLYNNLPSVNPEGHAFKPFKPNQ